MEKFIRVLVGREIPLCVLEVYHGDADYKPADKST